MHRESEMDLFDQPADMPIPLAPAPIPTVSVPATVDASRRILSMWLSGRKADTLAAYCGDLLAYCTDHGLAHDPVAAVSDLISRQQQDAVCRVYEWRSKMLEAGLAPNTINRRLAALRSLVKLAGSCGYVQWSLSVPNVQVHLVRETRGPQQDTIEALLTALRDRGMVREVAMVMLLFCSALRRAEVCGLLAEDIDLEAHTVRVLGKGDVERETVTIGERTVAALAAWLKVRGSHPGKVFGDHGRTAVNQWLSRICDEAGLPHVRPHGLRHSALTTAVQVTAREGRPIADVLPFSRHKRLATLMDNYYDEDGSTQKALASKLEAML